MPMEKQAGKRTRNDNLLREKAYTHIKDAIIQGSLKPKKKLTEEDLSSRIGTSRTPVREALQKLEKEELISRLPGRGFIVKGITEEEVEEVIGVQCLLEGHAAYLAASKITDEELALLHDMVKRQEECAGKKDVEGFIRLDREFHFTIHQAAKSTLLCSLLKDLRDLLHRYRVIIFRHASMNLSIRDHKKLLDCIGSEAPGKAERLIKKHITRRKNLIKRKVREGNAHR